MQELHIQRKFSEGNITIHITDDIVGVSIPFDDYMALLFEEMGQITTTMTKNGLKNKMMKAANALNMKMKSQIRPFAHLVKR